MRNLYLILLFSFGALLWTAFSIARHIRRQARQQALLSSAEEHKFEQQPRLKQQSATALPSASVEDEAGREQQRKNGSQT